MAVGRTGVTLGDRLVVRISGTDKADARIAADALRAKYAGRTVERIDLPMTSEALGLDPVTLRYIGPQPHEGAGTGGIYEGVRGIKKHADDVGIVVGNDMYPAVDGYPRPLTIMRVAAGSDPRELDADAALIIEALRAKYEDRGAIDAFRANGITQNDIYNEKMAA